jgi:Tfp pilus assembly protein PilF
MTLVEPTVPGTATAPTPAGAPGAPSADDPCGTHEPRTNAEPEAGEPLCRRASERIEAGAPHEDTVLLLRRALATGEPSAPRMLADVHLDHGERSEAAAVLAAAVQHGLTDLAGLLGDTLADTGDHRGAEEAYLTGVDAGDVGTMNDYGVFLRSRGRHREAAWVLERAAAGGDDIAPLNLVGLHLEELADLPSARAVAERSLDESKPATLVALADVHLAEGNTDAAEDLLRRAAELGGGCSRTWYGWFLQDVRGDLAAAERELRAAVEAAEPGGAFHLGRFLVDTGRMEDARPLLEEAAFHGDGEAAAILEREYWDVVDDD